MSDFDALGGWPTLLTTLLRGLAHMPLPKQGAAITSALADYQGGEARRDDVSMIGFMPTP